MCTITEPSKTTVIRYTCIEKKIISDASISALCGDWHSVMMADLLITLYKDGIVAILHI